MPFKKDSKVQTAVDHGTDKSLPKPGSNILLNVIQLKQQIIEFVDGDVDRTVTGDVSYEIRGGLETTIRKNETHKVLKNQTIDIAFDAVQTIGKNLTFTVIGVHNAVNIGPHN